jgi:hypothetical protein
MILFTLISVEQTHAFRIPQRFDLLHFPVFAHPVNAHKSIVMINIYWKMPKRCYENEGNNKSSFIKTNDRPESPNSSRRNPQRSPEFPPVVYRKFSERISPASFSPFATATSCSFSLPLSKRNFRLFPCLGSSKDIKVETFVQRFSVSSEISCCS